MDKFSTAAKLAIKQGLGINASQQYLKDELDHLADRIFGAERGRESNLHLIYCDPQNPVETVEIFDWPNHSTSSEQTTLLRRVVKDAYYLMDCIGHNNYFAATLQSKDMGSFPAFIVCGRGGTCEYNPNLNYVRLLSPEENGLLPSRPDNLANSLVHEWGHQIYELEGEGRTPRSSYSPTKYMSRSLINEAHSYTMETAAAYIAHSRGRSQFWAAHCCSGSHYYHRDMAVDTLHGNLELQEQLQRDVGTQAFLGKIFERVVLSPTDAHIRYYGNYLRGGGDGSVYTDRELSQLMPFPVPSNIIDAFKQSAFIAESSTVSNGHELLALAQEELLTRARTAETSRINGYISRYVADMVKHGDSKGIDALTADYLGRPPQYVEQHIRRQTILHDTPQRPVDLRLLYQSDDVESKWRFFEQLQVADLHAYTREERGDIHTACCRLGIDIFIDAGKRHIHQAVNLWRAFDLFMKKGGKDWGMHLIKSLCDEKQSLAFFIPPASSTTGNDFAQEIGLLAAIKDTRDWYVSSSITTRESVMRAIGLEDTPLPRNDIHSQSKHLYSPHSGHSPR